MEWVVGNAFFQSSDIPIDERRTKVSWIWILIFAIFSLGNLLIPSRPVEAITPGKWSYKDSLLLFPHKDLPKPKREKVFDPDGRLLLVSELVYKGHLLVEEIYRNPETTEGSTIYEYDKQDRLVRETTKDASGKTIESRDFVYKGNHLAKIRFFTEGGNLYMDSSIFQWMDDMIGSGEIVWMETKDKEKILITSGDRKRTMAILDENKKPIATVDFLYNSKGQLEQRLFTQGDLSRKNLFQYDSMGRLSEFSFHVKQDGKWILEKVHKLEY